ncbi:hypothetical protein [Sandarakinorhabdus sp.]|uniref:hypothetical protein n=1 Tax=Sandarakinorhabdus sp. TaxID=1916663 RepID=UPI003342587A
MTRIETDYLLIGAGAMGLAFADTLLTELPEATLTIVDRHGKPGGHWNDAYPFVTLHQPSSFYGVASMPLGAGRIDTHGSNAGMEELASGPEVSSYYDAVMRRQLLPTGRVRYFPMSDYRGNGSIVSLISGQETHAAIARKTIDSTYLASSVPSTHVRKFAVADGVRIMPPNGLPNLWQAPDAMPRHFTVLGAGKTAMDTLIWLLNAGATPDMITWVAPRASWFFNRRCVQPGIDFFADTIGGQLNRIKAEAAATDAMDLFLRMEAYGFMLRIDRSINPTMFHYAICSEAEIAILQRITDVVRMGRVQALEDEQMVLEQGTRATPPGTLFIDCTASAVERRPPVPVFQPGLIVPQMIRLPQPAFSAAMIAWIEAHIEGEAAQNALTMAVPLPDGIEDYPRASLVNMFNQGLWGQNPALSKWIHDCRLDGFGKTISAVRPDDTALIAILKQFGPAAMAAMANLQKLMV